MKVALWAEIRRLHEIEKLSQRGIARRLGCCRRTIVRALKIEQPPHQQPAAVRSTILDPYKPQIDAIIERYPDLSAVRVREKIMTSLDGMPPYRGGVSVVRAYLRSIRPVRGRVYQDITYHPAEAVQIDWGDCGKLRIKNTVRRVSVFVAVLCYSRMCYIEFTLSQRKSEFYRSLVHALEFFGGSPKKVVFDNLKAAVLNGSGRHACLHPEFQALCGHFYMEPIACAVRDPESKGMVETTVGYVKRNALQGRDDELSSWDDYRHLAISWREEVANVRIHDRLRQRPIDRFQDEKLALRPLPQIPFDTDEVVMTEVRPTCRIEFDGNRYTAPPSLARKPVTLRADENQLRIFYQGELVARHARCFGRRELIVDETHQLEALQMRHRQRGPEIQENFAALGPEAREFHLKLLQSPVRPIVHLRRVLELVRLYGRKAVVEALGVALQYETIDAAYVETIVHQHRRRQSLPSPTRVRPQRKELTDIHLETPDPGRYDHLASDDDEEPDDEEPMENA